MENRDSRNWVLRNLTFNRVAFGVFTLTFATFVYVLWQNGGRFNPKELAEWFNAAGHANFARGLITFLVVLVTMIIALTLVFSLYFGNFEERKERFMLGKEILTIFVGILGTIMGFYYAEGTVGVEKVANLKDGASDERTLNLETKAIDAFLSMDFESAIHAYDDAYSDTPTLRNIKEIRDLLSAKKDEFQSVGSNVEAKEALWKDLICAVSGKKLTLGMSSSQIQLLKERAKVCSSK